MGKMRNSCKAFVETLKRRDHVRDLGIDWKIILKWIFMK
jgi:hypothetical protein